VGAHFLRRIVIYPRIEADPMGSAIEVMPLAEAGRQLLALHR